MTFHPLKVRATQRGPLFVNDTGRFFMGPDAILERISSGTLTSEENDFFNGSGHAVDLSDPFSFHSHAFGVSERIDRASELDYLILVPTLRCNLSCSYCQVSRAGLEQTGYDWSDETLGYILALIDGLSGESVKIEFQGGEPSLRPDLIAAVIAHCDRFDHKQFVVCTNLQELSTPFLELLDREDVYISTSLDGDAVTHAQHRTGRGTDTFLANLRMVVERYGRDKVSALPTIDKRNLPEIDTLIDAYLEFGLQSIFLRPINFQGFARKRHKDSISLDGAWRDFYERFIRRIIQRNWDDKGNILEETYFSICLRRIYQPGADRHVDLRNPNPIGADYIVVDYDGRVYPSDEARMLARSGIIDLSLGDIRTGWDGETRALLNAHSTNQFDPSCQRCAYQPFCGRDIVDDLARYGRIDVERTQTEFCRRHLHLFDLIFELIYSDDPAVQFSLARWLRLPSTPAEFGMRLG